MQRGVEKEGRERDGDEEDHRGDGFQGNRRRRLQKEDSKKGIEERIIV